MSTNTDSKPTNVVDWFEIPVADINKARPLYEALLDRKLAISDFGGVPHAVISNADHSCVSGALLADPKRPPRRGSGTVIYLRAPDGVARSVSRAIEAGAKIVQPLTAIGDNGTIALIEDFDGNVIGLHEETE